MVGAGCAAGRCHHRGTCVGRDQARVRGIKWDAAAALLDSDPVAIIRSSSLCVHGPPGSIRWAELVCGRFSAAPTSSRRGGDTAPSYDSSVRRMQFVTKA